MLRMQVAGWEVLGPEAQCVFNATRFVGGRSMRQRFPRSGTQTTKGNGQSQHQRTPFFFLFSDPLLPVGFFGRLTLWLSNKSLSFARRSARAGTRKAHQHARRGSVALERSRRRHAGILFTRRSFFFSCCWPPGACSFYRPFARAFVFVVSHVFALAAGMSISV
jgi:hypothetical protein